MRQAIGKTLWAPMIAMAALGLAGPLSQAQAGNEEAEPQTAQSLTAQSQAGLVDTLQLAPETARQLTQAMAAHDYVAAEKLLLAEIDRDAKSARAARLLAFAGTVYFLNRDFMNAAIAWKKSEAIAPLDPRLRFSLAMAYIRMGHSDWARAELERLAAQDQKAALYPYWLGRLDYDGQQYNRAIADFQRAIALDPAMGRAYDNLGLCYYYQNQNDVAISNYEKAIELDRGTERPSPWPYLNLGIAEQFLSRQAEAEKNLREAIRLDPGFAKAHFQLGTVLEDEQKPEAARDELKEAARLNPAYAEPHMALARVYHKLGQEDLARDEVTIYLRLHPHTTP